MKKFLCSLQARWAMLLMLVCCCLPSMAVEVTHRSFLEEGKVWKVRELNSATPDSVYNYEITVGSDTIINGTKAKKILSVCNGKTTSTDVYSEEGQKVYQIVNGEKILCFDFGLNKGNKADVDEGVRVLSVDTVCLKGHYYRSLGVYHEAYPNGHLFPADYWIEGIGSRAGITPQIEIANTERTLLSVTVNGEEIYNQKEFTPTGIQPVRKKSSISESVYNLQGQRLDGIPQQELYIQNGKKHFLSKAKR